VADVVPLYRACPFCGSADAEFNDSVPGIMCSGCGATGPGISEEEHAESEREVIERAAWRVWNQRAEGT